MSLSASTRSMGDYAGLLRRRWRIPALVVPAVLLVGVLVANLLPTLYRATGALMSEGATVATETGQGGVRPGDRDGTLQSTERIELLRRRVMKPESLLELVKTVDPSPDQPGLSLDEKARQVADSTFLEPINPVTFAPVPSSTAFALHYQNKDPKVAAEVGTALLNLYVRFNSRVRAERASETTEFLRKQAAELEQDMVQVERKLAQFKTRYGDALPSSEGRNIMGADRARRDLDDLQRRILAAEERAGTLDVQLSELSPSLSSAVGNWRTELSKLKGELALAEQKYTPDHPDVRRLRRAISELSAKGTSSDGGDSTQADNPEYLRVSGQLSSVRREISALRSNENRIRSELFGYERNLVTAPNVETEYVQLTRQYEASQKQFNDLQQKIKSASFAENVESEAKGEKFAIIREVSVPTTPYSPNRTGILLISLLLGLGLGFLLAVIADAADPTVRSANDIEGVFGKDPIAVIPVLYTAADLQQRRRAFGSAAAIYAAAALVVVAIISVFGH